MAESTGKQQSKEPDREARIVAERRSLPDVPGVYLFRDRDDEVIYVGKAVSIRKRVASHFSGGNAWCTMKWDTRRHSSPPRTSL